MNLRDRLDRLDKVYPDQDAGAAGPVAVELNTDTRLLRLRSLADDVAAGRRTLASLAPLGAILGPALERWRARLATGEATPSDAPKFGKGGGDF